MALMSASNNPTSTNATGVYTFSMPHSVPAYLIALTVARYDYRARRRDGADERLEQSDEHERDRRLHLLDAALGAGVFDRADGRALRLPRRRRAHGHLLGTEPHRRRGGGDALPP